MLASRRRAALLAAAACCMVGIASCGRSSRLRVGADARAHLAEAARWADSVTGLAAAAPRPDRVGAADAVALGYLERSRLGFGSPFRLIDYALADPRLPEETRRLVAWALLDRVRRGLTHQVDALAVGVTGARERAHLALIERTVAAADDPRSGELTVRLAYQLARAEGVVPSGAPEAVAAAAALARDRRLAVRDARVLLDSARRAHVDPLSLATSWRRDRLFAVERPAWAPLSPRAEAAAVRAVARTLDLVRAVPTDTAAPPPAGVDPPALPVAAARRLAELPSVRGAPPVAPVVVALWQERAQLAGAERFVARARTEEALAAELALVRGQAHLEAWAGAAARAALGAAVGLRALAQEAPWFPGDPAPTARELRSEYALAAVSFDADVPPSWRPYYLRMLGSALADMRRVLPDLTVEGASVHFGRAPLEGVALAMHDPSTRTIYLPLATGAGTIAHEVAHDLDWQAARTLYRRRGGYGTDRAVADRSGRIAAALEGIATVALESPSAANGFQVPFVSRPTELFARNLDWLVAAALAREGRSNGYLTTVQDELLTGYASVSPADITRETARAMRTVLADVGAPAPARALVGADPDGAEGPTAPEVVRAVLEAPLLAPAGRTDRLGFHAAARALGEGAAPRACAGSRDDGLAAAHHELAHLAADARARGILRAET
ncbi:MAG: hypothetical protein ACJ8AO_18705, partial [Gemmatimonadaceae bacterium]